MPRRTEAEIELSNELGRTLENLSYMRQGLLHYLNAEGIDAVRFGDKVVRKYDVVYTKRITERLLIEAIQKGIEQVHNHESETQVTTHMIEQILCRTLKASIDTTHEKADVMPATSASARHKTKTIIWGEESVLKGEFLELANETMDLQARVQQLKLKKNKLKAATTSSESGMINNADINNNTMSETADVIQNTEVIVQADTSETLPDTTAAKGENIQTHQQPSSSATILNEQSEQTTVPPVLKARCSCISKTKAYALCSDIAFHLFQEMNAKMPSSWHDIEQWTIKKVNRAFS